MKKVIIALIAICLALICVIIIKICISDTPDDTVITNTSTPEATTPESTPVGTATPTPTDEPIIPVVTDPPPPLQETIDPDTLSGDEKAAYTWCDKAYEAAKESKSLSKGSDTESINSKWSSVYDVVCNQMTRYYDYYLSGGISYKSFECLMNSYAQIPSASGIAKGYIEVAKSKEQSGSIVDNFVQYVNKGKYMKATMLLKDISNASSIVTIKDLFASNIDAFKQGITAAVTEYMVRYELAEGKSYLEALKGLGVDDHIQTEADRLEAYRKFQDVELVNCNVTTTLENIYTHCLIAYPEINFQSKSTYNWCGVDCLTVSEFVAILNALYEKGYIIVDANLFYDAENDTINTTLKLPKGKKPLLLTFDDVTYDSRKDNRGMIDKLILDEDGYVCTYTKHADGREIISYENEIFPIINAFVREHPDFTFHGSRGTLFFTGFDGICGYRTQSNPVDDNEAQLGLDRQSEIIEAKQVIEALRDEGWTFGSHSYKHSRMSNLSASSFRSDTDRWLEEVGAIVGDTILFCWPYGDHGGGELRKNAEHKYLFDNGFKFFFGCGAKRFYANETDGNGIFSDRKAITGEALHYYSLGYKTYIQEYSYLFDPNSIWDPYRLPYKSNYLPEETAD